VRQARPHVQAHYHWLGCHSLRSIAVAAPSSNPYRPPIGNRPSPPCEVRPPTAPVQLQLGVAGSSTPPPPLQPVTPRAPPRPGRPVAPAPVRSSRCATTSTPRPSSTPRSVPPRSLACPSSFMPPPNHRPPSSMSVQCLSATQLKPMALDVTGPTASSGRHQPPRAVSSGRHRPAA
jgi:hypothetical protein